jgi:hypothetical protein
MATAIYLLSRYGKKFNRLYRKDLTIAVSIDRQNCDRLYSWAKVNGFGCLGSRLSRNWVSNLDLYIGRYVVMMGIHAPVTTTNF